MNILLTSSLLPFLALGACRYDAEATVPDPATLTEDAAGYYCQMQILAHPGPKAQIFVEGKAKPLWFAQVRDGIAYLRAPEQSGDITGFYVSDMGAAPSWEKPGPNNWISANAAYYVVGSDARGGMGAPELPSFGSAAKARNFAARRGGEVLHLADIPLSEVLAPVEMDEAEMGAMDMDGMKMDGMKMDGMDMDGMDMDQMPIVGKDSQ